MDTDLDSEALSTFVAITGAEAETARQFLVLADQNLDLAVAMFMENPNLVSSNGPRATANTGTNSTDANSSSTFDTNNNYSNNNYGDVSNANEVRAAIAPKRDTLVGGGGGFGPYDDDDDDETFALEQQAAFGLRGRAFAYPNNTSNNISSSSSARAARGAFNDPTDPSDTKANKLAKMFATPYEIMFDGNFEMAREEGRDSSKWILVTVSDRTEFACEAQKRDLWNNADVRNMITANFLFLFYSSESADGRNHMNFYKVNSLPYFAIIDPRTGESMKVWKNSPKGTELIQELATFLDLNSLDNFRAAPKRKASVGELTEEEQLNLAIAASLGTGGRSSSGPIVIDDDDEEEMFDAEDEEDLKLDAWTAIPNSIGAEPDQPPANITRVQFKLPDGSRVVRKFLKSDTVKQMFSFIKMTLAQKDVLEKFELLNFRDGLYEKLDQTLEEAKVLNSSITVELKE